MEHKGEFRDPWLHKLLRLNESGGLSPNKTFITTISRLEYYYRRERYKKVRVGRWERSFEIPSFEH